MYDTITIAPVHTGWWYLLLLTIIPLILVYVWLSSRMNNHKLSHGAGYLLQALVVFVTGTVFTVAIIAPMKTTPEYVADNQQAAMASQLHYGHISIDDHGVFTASTADGMYVSGVLLDSGDNVYTVKYTVAP